MIWSVLCATEDIEDGAFLNEFVIEEHFKKANLDDMLKESESDKAFLDKNL